MPLTYETYSQARDHLKDILDAAESGRPVVVKRDADRAAVVNVERIRHFLARMLPKAVVAAEDGGWSVSLPETFVAADGSSFDAAIDEMVEALREYVEDWEDHLLHAPNHQDQWGLVQLVCLSSDDELRAWLTSEP
jgi:predicted RNase H-like HicB family nuclease